MARTAAHSNCKRSSADKLVYLCCLFALLTAHTCPACAGSPDEFFSKGTAADVIQDNRTNQFEGHKGFDDRNAAGQIAGQSKKSSGTESHVIDSNERKSSHASAGLDLGQAAGQKVVSIGAIISGQDVKHLDQKLSELIELSKATKVSLGEVYIIGATNPGQSKKFLECAQLGANVKGEMELPPQYKVSYSPTWIVQTVEGQILLEAVPSLSRYFNSKGEFNEQQNPLAGIEDRTSVKSGGLSFE